ncbi:VanW family protein [Cellulosilyticum sp. I15G10I2]|uniref:VanW family protein n=1 Tax=Cellulosilyticum sp. I15G10I2 TaxID=1892843 RepID=UPI001A9A4B79|nr:VanW family protein [Cellulosilyticum sp. I15G10I2]
MFIQLLCGMISLSLGLKWGISLDLLRYENKLYKNMIVAGINVGNMSRDQALSVIKTQYIEAILEKELTLILEDKLFTALIKDFFIDSNVAEMIDAAYDYPNDLKPLERWFFLLNDTEKHFDVTLNFDETAIDLFVAEIVSSITHEPNDAAIFVNKGGVIAVSPHSDGYILDKHKLIDQINLSLKTYSESTINILNFAAKREPLYTTSLLENIDTCITTFNTSFIPNTNRATNIILSAEAINGTLLAPGDLFSFNTIVGNTTSEKGYKSAPVIVNSKISQGIGGGICQVSSTLYNAILSAGLSPLTRRPHSIPVNYVPLGLDATVSFNNIDFKFENTLDYPIYIESYVEKNQVYVNIYSNHRLMDRSYKLKSEVYQSVLAPSKFSSGLSSSASTKEPVNMRNKGYKVKVSRETYEKNVLIKTETISLDTY